MIEAAGDLTSPAALLIDEHSTTSVKKPLFFWVLASQVHVKNSANVYRWLFVFGIRPFPNITADHQRLEAFMLGKLLQAEHIATGRDPSEHGNILAGKNHRQGRHARAVHSRSVLTCGQVFDSMV